MVNEAAALPPFLAGGGEMAALIAAHDWSGSLGPMDAWPQSLKTTVGLMIHSPVPLVLLWGPDGIMLYNKAYAGFAVDRHPGLLGSKVLEGWPEAAELNARVMATGMAGGTLQYKDLELSLNRRGHFEPLWLDLFYSPVIDESGTPGGVIAVVVETTDRVLAERGLQAQSGRLAQMFQDAPSFMCQLEGPNHVFSFANTAYAQLIGHRDVIGKPIRQALPEIDGQGFFELLDQLYASGQSYRGRGIGVQLQRAPGAPVEERLVDFVYQPVRDAAGTVTGIFVEGIDVTDSSRAADALARSEQRLQLALDAAAMGSFVWNVADDKAEGDARMMALFGLPPDGQLTLRMALAERIDPRDGQRYADAVARACDPAGDGILREDIRVNLPDGRQRWLAITGQVVFEQGRPVQMAGAARDITDNRQAEIRRAALVDLSDRIRDIDDPDALAYAAAEILGQALGVSRAGYGTIDTRAETITIARDWNAPGIQSLAGTLHFRDYGSYIEELKRGETVVIRDASADPRTAPTAAALKAISAQAFVNMPVSEDGGLVALLYLNHEAARDWPAPEIAFIREVAERCRTAVERRRAESELRANEARLRFLDSLSKEAARSLDADEILDVTCRMVGDHLGVSICAYADMDADEDGFTIRGDWAAPGSPSIRGHYSLADFGTAAVQALGAGHPLVVNDTRLELAPDDAAAFQAMGVRATICMPLVKKGRLIALMAIHHKHPHAWTAGELALITEVTERSWAHIERVRDVAQLATSEAQFRSLAQAMPHHVWTADPDGLLNWLNDRAYAYAGAMPGTLLGNDWIAIVHPNDIDAAAAAWSTALETGSPYETEFRLRRADGQWRWHLARAIAIRDAGQVARWVGTNTDIEDQKEIAAALEDLAATLETRVQERTGQLQQAEEALRQSQKMEAVGQLTGGIAHDFNNLLQGITGALDRVQHRLAEGRTGDVERFLKAAVDSANRAAALTHRLLAFSRRQTLDPRPIDANRLIGGMEDLIRRTMGPNVQIEVVGSAGLWPVRVDPSQLENSLLNLCINARDAMPEGGKLTIETANKWLDERAAKERDLPPGQYVSLCVTDTGTGMTPEVIGRAFDPFFTTKPLGQGTGLGLSMIYGFVRQSGGQVRIYSEIGKGTTMCLYFPRHFGKAEEDGAVVSEIVERGFGETVMVVDDEATVRMLIAEVLSENYYNIIEAGDGPAALKLLESDRRIDLLITDVGLPGGMNGRQVADAARVARPDLKVLFITGYAENAAVANGHLEPGMEILAKPFAMSTLANKVRDMIEPGRA